MAVVGGGRMGEAIAAGLISSGTLPPSAIAVAEPSADRREVFARHGIAVAGDAHEIVSEAEIVLFAVKPQVIDAVVAHVADDIVPGTVVVSIAAGITTARLEAVLPSRTPVVRVMPNTPAMVGKGMAVVSGGSEAQAEDVERVRELFEAVGEAVVLEESFQDAATAISGSGPAYVALFVDALTDAGAAAGLSHEVARQLAIQTFAGTAHMLAVTGMHPQQLIEGVSSPGGTTVAALEALEAGGVRPAISAGVAAAVKRAKELGS
ncbi:pyrroline-5-carboxylate reductase [bacterium]|nr:pyrroline-5-carboxylate reductase [bacterium]